METSISYYLWLFIVFLFLIKKYLQKTNKRLPPSPSFSLPIIGHLYLFKKPLHRTLAKLSEKYGPILYLKLGSRPVLVVSSPSSVEECFTKNDISFANRPQLLAGKYLGYNYTTVIWAPYGSHWRNLRRIAALELLSSSRLQMFHDIRADEVRSLICKLFRWSNGSEPQSLDMKSTFFELTLNVLMRVIAGKRYYGEDIGESSEAKMFEQIVKESFQLSAPNIGDFLPVLKYVGSGGLEKKLVKLQKMRDEFMQSLIEERRKVQSGSVSEQKSKTMVDVLLSLQATEPEYYTDEIIKGMMQVMLSAGSDTSAGTMEWALSLLLNNPEALAKAQTEIDEKIGKSRLIEESDLANLPYLHCIISETLRMCSPAALIPPHESSEDCTVGGFNVPRGTMLLVNAWAIHHDPKLWEHPEQFKPERFQNAQERDVFMYLPFGIGRRGCPGEGLANRIVGLALGSVIQCFNWERNGEEMVDMTEGTGLAMPKAHPLLAKCSPRPTMLALLSQL
ncbi:PREDICTED: cytochrome P450 81D11-like [Fragaria vesca subsp. vesca]|uniref:cytochrome P450 81D11-like n=1 Tax=Fragaria vesca subsp. vesca TaxID=101020 RepID=UPI0002C34027|nr:PREDICTED: cytochrome P450 81D11-like [Fragaria vesca subsp. vesca]